MTRSKIPVKLILILNLTAVLALLIYFNNARRFSRKASPAVLKSHVTSVVPAAESVAHVAPAVAPVAAFPGQKPARSAVFESPLPLLSCRSLDTTAYLIKVGVKFVYAEPALKTEIVEKQEGLVTLVRCVFSEKTIAQIEAERCRAEILEKVNRFLSRGKVNDAVFTAFDIIPVPRAAALPEAGAQTTPAKEHP